MEMEIISAGKKRVDALFKGFRISSDQPVMAGGDGAAPSPFDLFLASIGTCAGFFVYSFCQERGLPVENIKLSMSFERDPATRLIGEISIDIRVPQDFPQKYLDALVNSANLCTVKKHLQQPPSFSIRTSVV